MIIYTTLPDDSTDLRYLSNAPFKILHALLVPPPPPAKTPPLEARVEPFSSSLLWVESITICSNPFSIVIRFCMQQFPYALGHAKVSRVDLPIEMGASPHSLHY